MLGTRIFRRIGRPWIVAATKSTLAAMVAWWLADRVVGSPQSFLAPYTALFMIGVTVRASGTAALRQVGVVSVGVTIAAAATLVLPAVPAIAATVALGTVVGRAKVFAPDGIWIAITALLVLLYGTATDESMVLYRIVDVALGALVGIVVNAVVVPPEFLSEARDLMVERARGQSNLLRNLCTVVTEGDSVEWELRADLWAQFKATGATAALDRGKDSLRGNIRRPGWSKLGGDRIYRPAAAALDRTLISLAAVIVGVEGLSRRSDESDDGSRADIAELLEKIADALDDLGMDAAHHRSPTVSVHLPEAMRLSEVVRTNIADVGADAEATATITVAIDSIASTLYQLGEGRTSASR